MASSSFPTTCCGITIRPDSDFTIHNLPLGVFSTASKRNPRCATILGDTVIDLSIIEEAGLLETVQDLRANVFCQSTLNAFAAHPRVVWLAFRKRLLDLFSNENEISEPLRRAAFHPVDQVTLHLPVHVGDYTDFYSSREHATNVGTMFRGKDNALQPNWLHLPVGYHGRASTIFVSGRDVVRPCGQLQKDSNDPSQGSIYGPCRLLDFELEVAAVVGGPANATEGPLTLTQAKDRIFGFLLMNDWSARDIQKWEYVPLGPFTAKNFATSVSPWIVMTAALEPFSAPTSAGKQTEPVPLDYLKDPNYSSYDVNLTVAIQGADQTDPNTVCTSNFKNLYWNSAQQLVHHTVTGCLMQPGDLLGSGTISGQTEESFGSMLELSWKGSREVKVGNEVRKFLLDGDLVTIRGKCKLPNCTLGFGECTGTVLPADTKQPRKTFGEEDRFSEEDRYFNFVLYGYWQSSSTWRVRVALAAKRIPYSTVPVDVSQERDTEFLTKSPLGQVPILEFTDRASGEIKRLSQSLAIIEFLDQAFPRQRSLIPSDALERARAYEMVQIINAGTQPLQNLRYLKQLEELSNGTIEGSKLAKEANKVGLSTLEAEVKRFSRLGPFCLGTFSPTIVDAVMVPQLNNARRYGVEVDAVCPTLVEIDQQCQEHPWFRESHPSRQPDAVK